MENNACDTNQKRICEDTLKNPLKGYFLGGVTEEEAESILRKKFGYNDVKISKLKNS